MGVKQGVLNTHLLVFVVSLEVRHEVRTNSNLHVRMYVSTANKASEPTFEIQTSHVFTVFGSVELPRTAD